MKGIVGGLDPETGKLLWSYDGWQCQTPVANVTVVGDDRLFITGGYGAGSAMVRISADDGKYVVAEVFKTKDFGTHVHPPVYQDGHLYGNCTTNTGRTDGMVCMSIDGTVKWKTAKDPLFDKGGLLLVDGLILGLDGNKGWLYMIEPNPNGFKPLAKAKVLDTQRCWAPLALSGNNLLVRDQEQLKCLQLP